MEQKIIWNVDMEIENNTTPIIFIPNNSSNLSSGSSYSFVQSYSTILFQEQMKRNITDMDKKYLWESTVQTIYKARAAQNKQH